MEHLDIQPDTTEETVTVPQPRPELPPRGNGYRQEVRILGLGAAEITYIGDDGEIFYDC